MSDYFILCLIIIVLSSASVILIRRQNNIPKDNPLVKVAESEEIEIME